MDKNRKDADISLNYSPKWPMDKNRKDADISLNYSPKWPRFELNWIHIILNDAAGNPCA